MKKTFFSLLCLLMMAACHNDEKGATTNNKKKEKDITPFVSALQQQVAQHPDSNGLRMKLAMELDSLNMFKPALAQMDSLIKSDSVNYGFWYTRGLINEHDGDTANAMRDYATAININPSTDALLRLANLYAEQKIRAVYYYATG